MLHRLSCHSPSGLPVAARWVGVALIVACPSSPLQARPIEAFAAPPALFPEDGGEPRPGAFLPVHAHKAGPVVGRIEVAPKDQEVPCTPKSWSEPEPSSPLLCSGGPALRLDGRPGWLPVRIGEWRYEVSGLVTYRQPEPGPAGRRWVAVEHPTGVVWVLVDQDHVHSFESLVYLVQPMTTWCAGPGVNCRPASQTMQAEMRRLGAAVGCHDTPYTVTAIVGGSAAAGARASAGSKPAMRHYRLELPPVNEAPAVAGTALPHTVFVPVRDARGDHTGTFYSRGC